MGGICMKHQDIISKLTLQEKINLCSGKDFWHMHGVPRLGLPDICLTDGPHGLRKKDENVTGSSLNNSVPTTCFPTAVTTACSWDPELLYKMGEALGEECLQEKVSVILGPGVNMKRSPLCGRNFEYFSEDPLLAGEVAAGLINGVQSKGVGTSLKHFAANSQEARRMKVDSVVDERALREIYLSAFEIAVKKAQPWTVMNAYNRLNGTYCADNHWLQTEVLRDEWGFNGIVVSDWGAVNDRVVGIKAGNDLEMPTSGGYNSEKLYNAVLTGALSEEDLDTAVDRLLDLILKSKASLCEYTYDKEAHHALARKIAGESMVLLKNDENFLPIDKSKKIGVIGELARAPRYQGAGSSNINPTKLDNAFDSFIEAGYAPLYAPGYDKKSDRPNYALIADAVAVAEKSDVVLLFVGLTEDYESEGYDRSHMELPQSHTELIEAVCAVNPNAAVVLFGGSPVTMLWLGKVKALLNAYLGGQAGGSAIVDILTGKVNPSGKLAETYPYALSDNPSYNNFPGSTKTVEYRESVYIGYRYYDTANKDVQFPFGYGLSYTKFEYSGARVSKKKIKDTDTVKVSFKIKNVGDVAGAEIAQVYVSDKESTIFRPAKELKGFTKVFLEPGEEKTVSIELSKRAFAYYNTNIHDWHVESGDFDILIGASSRDIRLTTSFNVESTVEAEVPDFKVSAPVYYEADIMNVPDGQFAAVLGREIPMATRPVSEPLDINCSLEDAVNSKWGKRINVLIDKVMGLNFNAGGSSSGMMKAMVLQIPIRDFVAMSGGVFTEEMAKGLLMILNGESEGKGLGIILKGLAGAIAKLPTLLKQI